MGTTLGEEACYFELLSAPQQARDEAEAASGGSPSSRRGVSPASRQCRRAKFALHLLV